MKMVPEVLIYPNNIVIQNQSTDTPTHKTRAIKFEDELFISICHNYENYFIANSN